MIWKGPKDGGREEGKKSKKKGIRGRGPKKK